MPNINDAFPSNYLKAQDLRGHSVPVVIDHVQYEQVGQNKETKPILYFQGRQKGLVLNKTNANKIMQILDSPITEEWTGQTILLYPSETTYQGDVVDCIRVKAASRAAARPAPPPPPEPEPDVIQNISDEEIPF